MALDLTRAALQGAGNACPIPGLAIAFTIADQMIVMAMTAKDNDGRLHELSRTVAELLLRLSRAMEGKWASLPETFSLHINQFTRQLGLLMQEMEKQSKSSRLSGFLNSSRRRAELDRWETRLLRAEQAFMLLLCVETAVTVHDLRTTVLDDVSLARNNLFAHQFRRYSSHLAQNLNGRLVQIASDSFAWGAWSLFTRHYWEGLGLLVSVKRFTIRRPTPQGIDEGDGQEKHWLRTRFVHQFRIRQYLDHPNVVPLIGTCDDLSTTPSLVLPFYKNGSVLAYLKENPDADRLHLVLGLARGLNYLHNLPSPIVNGDLQSNAVLIDDGGHARISGFSWSVFADGPNEDVPPFDDRSIKWFAPEMIKIETFPVSREWDLQLSPLRQRTVEFYPPLDSPRSLSSKAREPGVLKTMRERDSELPSANLLPSLRVDRDKEPNRPPNTCATVYSVDPQARLTMHGDIWAFAMTVLEISTPTSMTPRPMTLREESGRAARRGGKPDRELHRHVPHSVWTVLEECWTTDPLGRPSATALVHALESAKIELDAVQ